MHCLRRPNAIYLPQTIHHCKREYFFDCFAVYNPFVAALSVQGCDCMHAVAVLCAVRCPIAVHLGAQRGPGSLHYLSHLSYDGWLICDTTLSFL